MIVHAKNFNTTPIAMPMSPVDMTVSFMRPGFATTGKLTCDGKIVYSGGRIAIAEGRVWDEAGAHIAHGTESCLVMAVPVPKSNAGT